MTQAERRIYLIKELLSERPDYSNLIIPKGEQDQKRLLRTLMNVRAPKGIDAEFLAIQDEYLQNEAAAKGIVDIADLTPVEDGIYLWQGDITRLRCGAIVNAANLRLLGCFVPCHGCIDNAIHTYAGVQLRQKCAEVMREQGYDEPTGRAKITSAYNLPCDHVLHTVGPIISGKVTEEDECLLRSCYLSCLELAAKNDIESVAFCCISTGEFHFPNRLAAEIAVKTVREYKGEIEVIFNVFKDTDYEIYRELLGKY